MYIQIETNNRHLDYEIMGKEIKDGVSLASGESIESEGMCVTYNSTIFRKSVDFPYIITLAITFGTGVAASYIGSWLYNKIHGKANSISIDFTEVDIDENSITKIINMIINKK